VLICLTTLFILWYSFGRGVNYTIAGSDADALSSSCSDDFETTFITNQNIDIKNQLKEVKDMISSKKGNAQY